MQLLNGLIVASKMLGWVLLVAAAAPVSALASDGGDDTLTRIAQTNRIVIGARDSEQPLSYLDSTGVHIGYHIDVCERIVASIRTRLNLPRLQVLTVPTTLATRFALLNNRSVDIECGHNSVSASGMRQALLSHVTLNTEVRLMVRSDLKGTSVAGLSGHPLGVIVGGATVPVLRVWARNSWLKFPEVPSRTAADAFALLEQGRVDAILLPTMYLVTQRARSVDPGRYVILDPVINSTYIALMFRLEDERLHALANEALEDMMRSGEMARLYDKWFMQPIPGLSGPVGMPLPPLMQRAFAIPGIERLDM